MKLFIRFLLVALINASALLVPERVSAVEMCESAGYGVDGYDATWTQCSPYRPSSTTCYDFWNTNTATGYTIGIWGTACYPTQP